MITNYFIRLKALRQGARHNYGPINDPSVKIRSSGYHFAGANLY